MNATAPQAMMPSTFVSEPSSFCSGERVRLIDESIVAICPISVCIPVAVTTIAPVPRVTAVFWNSMFERSPSAASASGRAAAALPIGALSPVRAASCVSRVAEWMIRPSAGTMSPASTCTMSPGTTSSAGTSATEPSRTTRACGTCMLASASMLARAFSSWRDPSTTFSRISSATMMPVDTWPMATLTTVTAISMMFIGSRSWASATAHTDGGASPVIWFGPRRASRSAASAPVRPASTSEPADATTSSASRAYGGSVSAAPSRCSGHPSSRRPAHDPFIANRSAAEYSIRACHLRAGCRQRWWAAGTASIVGFASSGCRPNQAA